MSLICPVCEQEFGHTLTVRTHVRTEHPDVLFECKNRPPAIDVCGGTYEDFNTLSGRCSNCGSASCGDK